VGDGTVRELVNSKRMMVFAGTAHPQLAGEIAEHAPLTMAAAKEATRRLIAAQSPGSLEDLILSCYLSQDFQEGVRAFLEKRKPRWQGR